MWTIVEWYGMFIVAMMALIETTVQVIQARNVKDIKIYFENGYLNWYDVIVTGILM